MFAPLAPAVLDELAAEIGRLPLPMSDIESAVGLEQIATTQRGSRKPERRFFLIAAAYALNGADACLRRDHPETIR